MGTTHMGKKKTVEDYAKVAGINVDGRLALHKKMQSNLPAKKYKKGSPAQIRLSFEVPAGRVTRFIDIAQALSAINRKAYRQGVYYYVNSVEMYDNSVQITNLHVIPDTWITRAAYRRAKGLYVQ